MSPFRSFDSSFSVSTILIGLGGQQQPIFSTSDVVPFRFTPAFQHFFGPIVTEGIFAPSLMAIGRALTETEVSEA